MSAARKLVETNQEQVTQVMNSNEAMISLANSLRSKLAATKAALEKCRQETLRQVEPKIQELIENQKLEIERQRQQFAQKIEQEKANKDQKLRDFQSELDRKIDAAKQKCAQKLEKMKATAESRKKELKEAIDARLAQIPSKVAEKQKLAESEEDVVRREWEKLIVAKLNSEYEQKKEAVRSRAKADQEQKALEIIGQLEVETRAESQDLARKIEKESKEHEICIKRLEKRLEERKLELEDLQGDESHLDIEQDIAEMKRSLDGCHCAYYRSELEKVFGEIAGVDEEVEELSRAISRERQAQMDDNGGLRAKLSDLEEEKARLKSELGQIARQREAQNAELERQLASMEAKHKEQLVAIAERVKATVAKKDQVISDLKKRAEAFGILPRT